MNKRILSLLMVICLLICMLPTAAFAEGTAEDTTKDAYYKNYTAIGDSICAGFAQLDYEYVNGFSMNDNIEDSPTFCYARQVGDRLGSAAHNLGKCGCDSNELLDILENPNHIENGTNYYNVYREYLGTSDLITLEIGSNDLLMAVVDSILESAGTSMTHQQAMALVEPLLTRDIDGIVNLIEVITGIKLSEDQINAIKESLSDEALDSTLSTAYGKFIVNFPIILDNLRLINSKAELIILNYYNPFNITENSTKISTINLIQSYTDQMNVFTGQQCSSNGLLYVDISDIETNIDTGIPDPHPSVDGHKEIANRIIDSQYSITATAQAGGTITPAGENVVKSGSTLAFTIAAADGYTLSDVKVDGESKGALTEYKFEDIEGDHTITAEFSDGTTPPPSPTPSPTPTPPDKPYYNIYTALGDSITAGYTRPEYNGDYSNPSDCYVSLAATQLGVKRQNNNNLGLLGLDSEGLLNILNGNSDKYSAKFIKDLKSSDLISIDIGSNDLTMTLLDMIFDCLDYDLGSMTPDQRFAAIEPFINNQEVKLESLEDLKKINPKITDEQIEQLFNVLIDTDKIDERFGEAYNDFTKNWDAIIEKIREDELNPDAAIVALGYYNISPKFTYKGKTYEVFKKEEGKLTVGEKYVGMMNKYISEESKMKDQYVYVKTDGVELVSFGGIVIDPHPSDKGHADLAKWLVDAILNDITAVDGSGVTVSPKGTKTVAYGLTDDYTYTYTFTPSAGNRIEAIYVDGEKVEAPDGAYTFKKVTGNHTIGVSSAVIPYEPVPINDYNVTTNASKGGKVETSVNGAVKEGTNLTVREGNNVTITITPDLGYTIDYIMLNNNKISNTNTITISNISSHYNIYVAFKESEEALNNTKNPFTDVKSTDWFYKEAMYMYGHKIMKGTSETTFGPNVAVSRAMIVAILYRMENEPAVTYKNDFTDVAKDKWYTNAVLWAAEKGILKGYGDGKLGPEDEVTREQIVNILYQYAVCKGYNTNSTANLSGYTDTTSVSEWASTAMQWAVKEGLINGKNNQLDPGSTATRAEIAAIIYRFLDKY